MNRKWVIAFFCALSTLFSVNQAKADIYSTSGKETQYIKVSKGKALDSIRFELCSMVRGNSCERIGGKDFNVIQIRTKKRNLLAKGLGTMALDVASLAALPIAGMWAGAGATLIGGSLWIASGIEVGTVMWVGMGAGLATHFMYVAKKLNPKTSFNAAKIIKNDVLSDDNVYIKGSIEEYARELEELIAQ